MTNKYLEKIAANRHEQHVMSKMDISDPNRDRVPSVLRRESKRQPGPGQMTVDQRLNVLKHSKKSWAAHDPAKPQRAGGYEGSRFTLGRDPSGMYRRGLNSGNSLHRLSMAERIGRHDREYEAFKSSIAAKSNADFQARAQAAASQEPKAAPSAAPASATKPTSTSTPKPTAAHSTALVPAHAAAEAASATKAPTVAKGLSRAGKVGIAAGALAGIAGIGAYMHNQKA